MDTGLILFNLDGDPCKFEVVRMLLYRQPYDQFKKPLLAKKLGKSQEGMLSNLSKNKFVAATTFGMKRKKTHHTTTL